MPIPLLIPALIAGGATLLSGIIGGVASNKAANTQAGAAQAGIDEQKRQFDAMQALLAPYIKAGQASIDAQGDIAGLNGPDAQKLAIDNIANSPEFAALTQQGENAILQNASATGGLRGGNVQGALAQFRPALLSELINKQYERLGGLSALGASSGGAVGSGGLQTGANIADLSGQQGAAQAGGQLATGAAWQSVPNALMAVLGTYAGLGGKF